MRRPADAGGREAAIRHRFARVFGAVNHGEHDSLRADIEGFLRPGGGIFRQTEDCGGVGGCECADAVESLGDAAGAVFHINYDEIVAGETGDLGEGRGEAEEEEAVEGFAIFEAGFEGLVRCGGGDGVAGRCVGGVGGGFDG